MKVVWPVRKFWFCSYILKLSSICFLKVQIISLHVNVLVYCKVSHETQANTTTLSINSQVTTVFSTNYNGNVISLRMKQIVCHMEMKQIHWKFRNMK